ncbi:hypothetical protein [Flavobacterium kingsejongi]|nr:hypothetical protein [Flavobacterium kingsejongi]
MKLVKEVFHIGGQSFKIKKQPALKKNQSYSNIKNDITTIENLNAIVKAKLKNRLKKDPDFYYADFFDLWIYKEEDPGIGFLYPVEKTWIVED